jgi:hypothetical protein
VRLVRMLLYQVFIKAQLFIHSFIGNSDTPSY